MGSRHGEGGEAAQRGEPHDQVSDRWRTRATHDGSTEHESGRRQYQSDDAGFDAVLHDQTPIREKLAMPIATA